MRSAKAPEAMGALLDRSAVLGRFTDAYRSGDRLLVTDGCLVLRCEPDDVDELESFEQFDKAVGGTAIVEQNILASWKSPHKLFRVDVATLMAWADNNQPLVSECAQCAGSCKVPYYGEAEEDDDDGLVMGDEIDCDMCSGTGIGLGTESPGWLTCKRLVDRRYIELIVALAREGDVIDVRAQSDDAQARLYFRGQSWDAWLMPLEATSKWHDDNKPAAALWTPQPVLEGDNA